MTQNNTQLTTPLWHKIFSRHMLICVFTGFSSGLPLYFLINLVPAWLRNEGVDLTTIGLFSIVGLPFTWKFLWSPLMDAVYFPWLGRRRSWMFITQVALLLALLGYMVLNPQQNMTAIKILSLFVAFFAASQDIVLDAFRREILQDNELGLGNAIHVNAYRIAALVPGSLALILADIYPWPTVFAITALFMLPGMLVTLFLAHEPKLPVMTSKSFKQTVIDPFDEFFARKGVKSALLVLFFIFLYKLGDSMATALATPFYLDMGFSKKDIGLIAKNAGLWPTIIAGILGGIWMIKLGINRALWLFGLVQVFSILGFAWLASQGPFTVIGTKQLLILATVIGFEAVGVGLGTAAFVAYMARETNPAFTATQLALFTSLAAVPRTLINATTGYLVNWLGYVSFFWLCFFLALPGMLLLVKVAPWNKRLINV
ncbi:AmpG family muropeptide MFS transporter [Snodgrassella communis]|uniref:AmpG permease n=1 Tax=Snodgrassella communis TaxID=2946699 RepID=A0A836MQI5_9NEIS|nr:AmpG family muropeptide MFS transporter [Snodgrassella communis]KDN14884.1 AmpG permease [Snodgrassella communis]PIT08684.1 AmpG family muropeptide MFS transporter [Snodgrassella communis]PIT29354.1 AmpG family muropeptide MFS transporter [Snodgrassella communis]PIT29560.1 AmpG family muropeptide MFS transporter [Snodgrassella communis]PIT35340.1 AmpG family muropeptide MFS transporter [Snodgrassella communis]